MLKTRDFGEIEIDQTQVVEMAAPVLGFERFRSFVLLQDEEMGEQFRWLQSTQEPSLCFVLFPNSVFEDYHPTIPADIAKLLGADGGETEVYVIATIPKDAKKATVNLKSPLVINRQTQRGAQVVLDEDLPVRFPLFSEVE